METPITEEEEVVQKEQYDIPPTTLKGTKGAHYPIDDAQPFAHTKKLLEKTQLDESSNKKRNSSKPSLTQTLTKYDMEQIIQEIRNAIEERERVVTNE